MEVRFLDLEGSIDIVTTFFEVLYYIIFRDLFMLYEDCNTMHQFGLVIDEKLFIYIYMDYEKYKRRLQTFVFIEEQISQFN